MRTTKQTKRALLDRYLAEARLDRITETDLDLIRQRLSPVSEAYLRELVRSSGVKLDPVVEGVRQGSFEELGRTLDALAREFQAAVAAGDRRRAERCRGAVLTGKEHARLALRRVGSPPETGTRKQEMISWMLVWLENPEIFPAWLALRRKAGGTPP
ncbi:MAG: hypothetical protein ACE141_11740 [Bryobacteraceae bacterium]